MAGSIASELLSTINQVPYKVIISALPSNVGISETLFPKTQLATKYKLDIHRWVDGSFMNPNALFEYFGLFSNEDSKTVRKNMLKYLGLHKKDGWKTCNTLKNSWITLHMKGLTTQEWADSMKKGDTASDEIALHVLCRMYNRHCMVYTKMNIWSTVGTDVPIPEETLIGMCDIRLLFIETDVFGKFQIIPYAPAPRTQQYGDARSGLPALTDGNNNNSVSPPLNLSVVTPTTPTPTPASSTTPNPIPPEYNDCNAIGDNAKVDNANAVAELNGESKEFADKPPINSECEPDVNGGHVTPQRLKIGELDFSLIWLSSQCDVKNLNCTLKLMKLSEHEIDKWQGNRTKMGSTESDIDKCTQVGGHNL